MSDKGRWFRVYARQVREHEKFRPLSALELGAWTALRAEAELRDKAMFPDLEEAALVLKRRRCPNPKAMVQRMVMLRLFDVQDDGTLIVHDRADHDRPLYPSDSPEAVAERKRRSREKDAGHDPVTTRDDDGHDTHAGVQPQPSSPAPANSPPPQPGEGLPDAEDSATMACRFFLNGGRWLDDKEYVAAWEDLDRRFGDWVKPEIQPAYRRLFQSSEKVKPWSLLRAVEMALAERSRRDELERERAEAEATAAERKRLEERAAAASEEEKRRASISRRAIGLWLKRHPADPVPTDFDELEQWLADNDPDYERPAAA